jgi:hypothetical protein
MLESGERRPRARTKRRLIDALVRRESRRIVGGIVVLVLALVAVGVFAGFRTRAFLCAEVVAIALVLGLCARVDVTRRRRGGA